MNSKNHELTREEWLKLWEDGGWKREVTTTCYEVANSNHAAPQDREIALGILSNLILMGEDIPDPRPFPQLLRDVQISIVRGGGKPDKKVREALTERMDGVKWTLGTISQFVNVRALLDGLKGLEASKQNEIGSN